MYFSKIILMENWFLYLNFYKIIVMRFVDTYVVVCESRKP